jgi:hypothetical protein
MEEVANIPTEAPAPPPAPDHHATELAEIRESLARLEKAGEYEIPALSDSDSGREKKIYAGPHDSSRFLARRRREEAEKAGTPPAQLNPEPDLVLHYQDGRAEVSAKDAAKDLADYRARLAQELLQGTDLNTAAMRASGHEQPAEAQPVEQPAEQAPPSYSQEQVQQAQQEAQWQATVLAHAEYEAKLGDVLLAFQNHPMPAEFSQLKTADDWMRIQQTNPALAQQMANYVERRVAAVNQLNAEHAQVQEQRRQVAAAQFADWGKAQDAEFERHAGEISRELQIEALTTLKDVGLDERQIAQAWNGHQQISLRSAGAQRLVLDATKWRLAEAKAKAAIARPSPPPQRPGVRQDIRASVADLNNLSRQLDGATSAQQALKLGARLVAERRRAQG